MATMPVALPSRPEHGDVVNNKSPAHLWRFANRRVTCTDLRNSERGLRLSPRTSVYGEVRAPMVAMPRLPCLTDKITPTRTRLIWSDRRPAAKSPPRSQVRNVRHPLFSAAGLWPALHREIKKAAIGRPPFHSGPGVRPDRPRSCDRHRDRNGRDPISKRTSHHGYHRHLHPLRYRRNLGLGQDPHPQRQVREVRARRGRHRKWPGLPGAGSGLRIRSSVEEAVRQGQFLSLCQARRSELRRPICASLVETEGDELALIWSRRRAIN